MATKKLTKDEREKCRILTPVFRVSYPHVFKASAMKGTNNDPKYSLTMLFKKDANIDVVKKAIFNAKVIQFGKDKTKWPEIESPFVDGDGKKGKEKDGTPKEGYAGHYALKASCSEKSAPTVLAADGETELTTEKEFYAGCYARAFIFAYVWEFPKDSGTFGVGLILDHVQKAKDGQAFGGKKAAKDVFTPFESDDEDVDSDDESDDEEVSFI